MIPEDKISKERGKRKMKEERRRKRDKKGDLLDLISDSIGVRGLLVAFLSGILCHLLRLLPCLVSLLLGIQLFLLDLSLGVLGVPFGHVGSSPLLPASSAFADSCGGNGGGSNDGSCACVRDNQQKDL